MSLHKCLKCKSYTLKTTCPKCKEEAVTPIPPRFSIEKSKKYSKYRRAYRKQLQDQK
ncbi:MAG: ribosome biogenesis protein [Asgard group archaeon]|nr:ribosome biogenesis protein [Asgard group archaeon]